MTSLRHGCDNYLSQLRHYKVIVDQNKTRKHVHHSIVCIMHHTFSHAYLVDSDVIQEVIYNQDRAISLALIQIHERSLQLKNQDRRSRPNKEKQQLNGDNLHLGARRKEVASYADIVKKSPLSNQTEDKSIKVGPRNSAWPSQRKLFFTKLEDKATVLEIWRTFKRLGEISDIIIPNRRDRFGKRFGFILAKNNEEAAIIWVMQRRLLSMETL